jgi:hypothetical protein
MVNDDLKDKNCAIMGYYEANSSNSLPTFQDNLLFGFLILEDGNENCPETSARNYHYSLRNKPEERSSRRFRKFYNGRKFITH